MFRHDYIKVILELMTDAEMITPRIKGLYYSLTFPFFVNDKCINILLCVFVVRKIMVAFRMLVIAMCASVHRNKVKAWI